MTVSIINCDILINELRVIFLTSCAYCTSYDLLFIVRVTSYLLHASYELQFIARVTSSCLHTSYKLVLIARVKSYLLHASYELLFIVRVAFLTFFFFVTLSLAFLWHAKKWRSGREDTNVKKKVTHYFRPNTRRFNNFSWNEK